MAKYFGVIGYVTTEEEEPGVWVEKSIVEREYYGDLKRNSRRYSLSSNVNGDISISNQISILSDSYANEHIEDMRYITYLGKKWTITDIEVEYPRLTLSIGGIYNGQ